MRRALQVSKLEVAPKSRLICSNAAVHRELENELEDSFGAEGRSAARDVGANSTAARCRRLPKFVRVKRKFRKLRAAKNHSESGSGKFNVLKFVRTS